MRHTLIQRALPFSLAFAFAFPLLPGTSEANAQEKVVKIAGVGAKSGVLRPFGVNSEAAMRAAAEEINESGGVTLGDGTKARIVVEYFDDRCDPQEGIAVTRRIAAGEWLASIGSTCSSVVEPVFGVLQKKAGDTADSGLQVPIFTDVAMKIGLAGISDWSFRNIPEEIKMYDALFAWLKTAHPEAKTVYGGVEDNFVHSRQTWYDIMKERAKLAGFDVKGEAKWLLDDTNFTTQVQEIKDAGADIVMISAHPFTTCGVLKEMSRQGVKPDVLVGLTSASSPETVDTCGAEAEGLLIPTSFAPINDQAKAAAEATARYKGYADLHSMAAWENMFMIKEAMEAQGVLARPDTVAADRAKIRAGLAGMKEAKGLLGTVGRRPDGESIKPYVFVEARGGAWEVVHTPQQN
ncbi:ABC transporter substrate-binding protein [Arenibaculum sp.]|uniref:ABC transporter substrate-binding protein n=1 Tax=Arenibaculum sp. TaxID=2865862 RepID=UPI002E13413A|nr:ABC transporter substrate-binding protein [Arenibaculum sp.]